MPGVREVDHPPGGGLDSRSRPVADIRDGSVRETRRLWLWVTAAGAIVGLGLRWGIVATRDIWCDEAFTWRVTAVGFDQMYARVENDFHPPLHYLLMWLFQAITPDDWSPTALRAANLVWFVGMAGVAAWSVRRPATAAAVVPSFAVVAVAPGFVQLSADLRMYGMLLMLVSVLLVAATTMIERPSRSALVVAAVATSGAVWTHYGGVIAAGAITAAGLLHGDRRSRRAFVVLGIAVTVAVGALVPFAASQLGHGIGYRVAVRGMVLSILNDLGVVGIALVIISLAVSVGSLMHRVGLRRGGLERGGPQGRRRPAIGVLAGTAAGLFAAGMAAWWIVRGQNPINDGVATIVAYLLLVAVLGLGPVPARLAVVLLVCTGLVTAGISAARLWGGPNYALGKRVSPVDVLDATIDRHPALADEGGRGWLVVEVDFSDMNHYFRERTTARLPSAKVAVATPSVGAVTARVLADRRAHARILVIRRPGVAPVRPVEGYRLVVLDRWTAWYVLED